MLANAFIGQASEPDDAQLTAELGSARRWWDELLAEVPECDVQEWNSYSPNAGWALRLKHGGRAILYLSPGHGGFTASFALGGRAVKAARAAGLRVVEGARKYAEGTAVRIDVKSSRDVATVRKLAEIKLAN